MNNKILRTFFRIKQPQYCLPSDSLKTFCYSLIVSYGLLAGGNANESVKYKTSILHKRAIRAINKASYSITAIQIHYSELLKWKDLHVYELKVF